VRISGKILIEVFTPGNGKTYEFQLDGSMTAASAKSRIIDEILRIEEQSMSFHEETQLYDMTLETVLPDNAPLSAVNVESGHKLLLV